MRKLLHKLFLPVLSAMLGFALCVSAQAEVPADKEVASLYVSNPELVGQSRFDYWLWDVYDISLLAPDGKWNPDKPYALTLEYLMDFKGEAIAERSVKEMRQIGFDNEMKLAAWFSQMKEIFPNIEPGERLTGIYRPGQPTRFYHNGEFTGEVKDPEFGPQFFGIWLNPNTSEPMLRKRLLGAK